MEISRRDLSNDMAEHRPILKNNQIRTTPVLVSRPKQVWKSLKQVFRFYCVTDRNTSFHSQQAKKFQEKL